MAGNELVWPVDVTTGVNIGWDPEQPRSFDSRRHTPDHTTHLPYEPLTAPAVAIDNDGVRRPHATELRPRLATEWLSSDDYRTWTLRLRRGALSSAGNELTAEDVHWSWERTYALRGVGLWRGRQLAGLGSADDIEVVANDELRFRLSGPNPQFPHYLVFSTANIVDSTEARRHATDDDPWAAEWLAAHTSGFGPYLVESESDDRLSFAARDDHWAGRPHFDRIEQLGVTHREQALRMLDRGEANAMYPEELARFERDPRFVVARWRANHSTLEFNWLEPPFDDASVRRAICHALPYERILDEVYGGRARPSHSPILGVTEHHTPEFWRYNTDPERARELMRGSAYPDGFETELVIRPNYESLRFAEIAEEALREIGVRATERVETRLSPGGAVPMWFKYECVHALHDPLYDLSLDYAPPRGMPGGKNLVDPRLRDPIRAVRSAPADEQPALYRGLQRTLLDFAPSAFVAEIETGWVMRSEVAGAALDPTLLGVASTGWWAHRWLSGWW